MADDADIICCDVCQIVFSNRSNYNRHRRKQHPQTGNRKSTRNRKSVRNNEVGHPNIQPRPTKRGTSDLLPRTNIGRQVTGGADTGRDTAKQHYPTKRREIVLKLFPWQLTRNSMRVTTMTKGSLRLINHPHARMVGELFLSL